MTVACLLLFLLSRTDENQLLVFGPPVLVDAWTSRQRRAACLLLC